MIRPFSVQKTKQIDIDGETKPCPSMGLSTCGYDVMLQPVFKVANHNVTEPLDIMAANDEDWFLTVESDRVTIPPHGFVLGVTVEHFNLPNYLCGSLFCKSTYARRGISLPPTVAEPGWSGELVVEVINNNPFPVIIHSGIGIGQMLFFRLDEYPDVPYTGGKYDGQTGITHAKY